MANWQYNTGHGNFQIEGRKKPALLEVLNKHLGEGKDGFEPFDTVYDAFNEFGFEIVEEEQPYTGNISDDDGDIIDVALNSSHVSESNWKTLQEVVAPFVTAGSFLVFFGDNCFAIVFEKNKETDLVEGLDEDVEAVPYGLMKRIFHALKDNKQLYDELCSKYVCTSYRKD
jgi:hypothetical protein